MNSVKPAKWNRFFKSNPLHMLFIAVVSPFIVKVIEKHGGENLMKSLFQSYFVELWPIWFGIGLALAYFIIRRSIEIDNFLRKGLKFDDKLNELLAERRGLMTHVHNSYNGLSNRIDKIERAAPHT